MIEVEIDGRRLRTEPDRTILEVARDAGIYVPTLCHSFKCRMENAKRTIVENVNELITHN